MTDLTAITTPFGLLDRETQEALKAHGGPWEVYFYPGEWQPMSLPNWNGNLAYRVQPAPPKPREWWAVQAGPMHIGMWPSERDAQDVLAEYRQDIEVRPEIIHVREVLE